MAERDDLLEQDEFYQWLETLDPDRPLSELAEHPDWLEPPQFEPEELERLEELGREWTRAVMRDLEDRLDQDLDWYAVQHHNTDDPHVHVVLSGTGMDRETGEKEPVELTPQDFRSLRESGREHSDYDHYHFIEDALRDLDERDTILQESPEHLRTYEHEIER